MMSFFTPRSSNQKRMAKIQLVTLTAALLLALVVLPASADHEEEAEYTFAYEEASASSTAGLDADSARLSALGKYVTAMRLEASRAADSDNQQIAEHNGFYADSDSEVSAANSTDSFEADSARLSALGEYYTAKGLEASQTAASDRYNQLAAFYASSDGGTNQWLAGAGDYGAKRLAAAGAVDSGFLAENPELSSFHRYCGC